MNDSPYVGPRPFLRSEADRFFGRRAEARILASDWLTERVTILHGPAAVGKTSLLNAGVLPLLSHEPGTIVLPPGRISPSTVLPTGMATAHNGYVYPLLCDWGGADLPTAGTRIAEFIRPRMRGSDPSRRLLVAIDQVEEIFTAFPTRVAERDDLLAQIAEALSDVPALNLLLIVRDDHLASVAALEGGIGVPAVHRRLDALTQQAAVEAIQRPLLGTGRELSAESARNFIDRLRTTTYTDILGNSARITSELVEPLHLQIVCAEMWSSVDQDETVDVQQSMRRFYDRAVRDASLETETPQESIRRWLEKVFTTEYGTRGIALRGLTTTADMPNSVADALADRHVLTAQNRLRGTWYQLGQDLLIQAVRQANQAWFEASPPAPSGAQPEDFATAAAMAFNEGDFSGAKRFASVAASRYEASGDTRRQAQALALHGKIALVEGDLRAADESFRKAVAGFDSLADRVSTARSLTALAGVRAAGGNDQAAIDLFRQALERNRADVEALTELGYSMLRLGRPADAEASFNQAMHWDPANARAMAGRGQARLELLRHASALEDLDRGLALGLLPDDEADTQSARAVALAELGRLDEARQALEVAELLASDRPLTRARAERVRG